MGYRNHRSNCQKVKKGSTVQQGQPSSSVEVVRPSAPLSYLDPSKLKRKRLSVGFVSSAATWDVHQHPVYGYTNTDFDYQSEVHLVRDIAMHSYKEGTTCAEMGHLKYWHSFCSIQRTCVDKISAIRFWGGVGGADIKNLYTPLAPQTRRTTEY